MDIQLLYDLVGNGHIFTAKFVKRTDGTERIMNCRTGVKKHQTGGGLKFDPSERGLLSVYDMKEKGYRFINVDSLVELKVDGIILRF